MEKVASASRGRPDAKTRELIRWIDDHLCPDRPRWNGRRVLIFTENVIGTKRYLREMLEQAIAGTDLADERIETIDGQTAGANRKEIQRRFNADPADDPLRILIATDAAREGLNFQAHCTDLFHFDLPWNPGRIEQRNGRIDRKLQPAAEVRCHYFALPQRAEDRVLEVLVRKTQTIKRELGSLSKVIDDDIERRLRKGIRHRDAKRLAREIEAADLDQEKKRVAAEELEAARERQEDLKEQIERCRGLLDRSRRWVGLRAGTVPRRDVLLAGVVGGEAAAGREGRGWLPGLDVPAAYRPDAGRCELDRHPGYVARAAQEQPEAGRVAARSPHPPGRLRGRGRAHRRDGTPAPGANAWRSACWLDSAPKASSITTCRAPAWSRPPDSIPRVILLGRLCLYGRRAERLHEILTPVAARWIEPSRRTGPLRAYAGEAEARTLERLESALQGAHVPGETTRRRLLETAFQDITDLLPQLEERADLVARSAADALRDRGESEAQQLRVTLERQRQRVAAELGKHDAELQLTLEFSDEEKRQRQADVAAWRRRLGQFDRDLETEPSRIREFYEVRAQRVEPVGLVYLWPDTG